MSLPFMKMYWGDYLGDTYHLRAIEHGGYLLLIAHYWRVGSLPSDPAKLAQIARMTKKEWASHGDVILEFFKDGKHKRIDEERAKANAKSAKAVNAALQRWEGQKEPNLLKTLNADDANASILHSECNAIQNQIPEPKPDYTITTKEIQKEKTNRSASSAEFDEFWSVYPRRVGRGLAEKAWKKALTFSPASEITSVARSYPWPSDPQYIPHPATWLNQRRWQDDLTSPPSKLESMADRIMKWAEEKEHERKISIESNPNAIGLLPFNEG